VLSGKRLLVFKNFLKIMLDGSTQKTWRVPDREE
jgi:hypothetical protein